MNRALPRVRTLSFARNCDVAFTMATTSTMSPTIRLAANSREIARIRSLFQGKFIRHEMYATAPIVIVTTGGVISIRRGKRFNDT